MKQKVLFLDLTCVLSATFSANSKPGLILVDKVSLYIAKIISVISQFLAEIEIKLLVFYDRIVERKNCFVPVLKLRRVFRL